MAKIISFNLPLHRIETRVDTEDKPFAGWEYSYIVQRAKQCVATGEVRYRDVATFYSKDDAERYVAWQEGS